MRGRAQRAIAATAVMLVTTGCLGIGGDGKYAKYQHRKEALEQIDVLLASVPQYPGARLADRHDDASGYDVAVGERIEAEPYRSTFSYLISGRASGAGVMLHFRRSLPARGWQCAFQKRERGVLRRLSCRRDHQMLAAVIDDRGHYELTLQASDLRPPIKVIDGD